MNPPEIAVFDLVSPEALPWEAEPAAAAANDCPAAHRPPPAAEVLRACAWEIGEQKPAEAWAAPGNHVGLAMVAPYQGFAYWRIHLWWVEQLARQKGGAWQHSRMILRLYDVSYIEFNGFNAHSIQDHTLPAICGQMFFKVPRPGTVQLAEVGFLLRSGEFLPAARSQIVQFARDRGCAHGSQAALLVDGRGLVKEVSNVWEQERILQELRQPRLRKPLRLAAFAMTLPRSGEEGSPARFAWELALGQHSHGHEVHLFGPRTAQFGSDAVVDGVHYHPLDLPADGTPLDRGVGFARAAQRRLQELPPFDLLHYHEWMTGLTPADGACPTILSLSSTEATRRNGSPPCPLSRGIEEAEREAARRANYVLTSMWLRDRAVTDLGLETGLVHPFPMEGRLPNEWESPLDYGQVKKEIHLGPLDRMMLFIGPLEHAAGVDLLVEALPVLLQRTRNVRIAFVGAGNMHGHLEHRAHQLGVAYAVRLLGHVEGPQVHRLLRSAEALLLPSRYRVPFDDAVVDLARRAGKPVVTTHSGPAHLVRHEENGIITYDNPGSMVWALDRLVSDPGHAERMGRKGKRHDTTGPLWGEVARHYLEFCAAHFPELTELRF